MSFIVGQWNDLVPGLVQQGQGDNYESPGLNED